MPNVVIVDQACDFGAKTEINAGAYQLVNTGGDVLSIGAVTGTASTQYNAAVVSGQVVLTAKVASPSAGTVIIADITGIDTVNIGSATVTVSTIASAYSASTMLEMMNAYDGSILGEQILTRDFYENPTSARWDFKAPTALPSGTYDGTNHVKITPHSGAITQIGGIWLHGASGAGCRYVYFDDIDFTGDASAGNTLVYIYQGASDLKFTNCNFEDSRGYAAAGSWISAILTNSNYSNDATVTDCTFNYVGSTSVAVQLSGNNMTFERNIANHIDSDFLQHVGREMDNPSFNDNKIWMKYIFNPAAHGDFYQILGSGLIRDATNLTACRNVMIRGQDVNDEVDGQGIFSSDFGARTMLGATVENNEFVGTMVRGISVKATQMTIRNNLAVFDWYADPLEAAGARFSGIFADGDQVIVTDNVTNFMDTSLATNVTEDNNQIAVVDTTGNPDSYDGLFNAPTGGAALTSSNFITSYKAKIGGLLDGAGIGARDTAGDYIVPTPYVWPPTVAQMVGGFSFGFNTNF